MRRHIIATAVFWTACVVVSYLWSARNDFEAIQWTAKSHARVELAQHVAIFDAQMRQQAAAPLTSPVSPFADKNLAPQWHSVEPILLEEDAAFVNDTISRLVSIDSHDPKAFPDEWERNALARLADEGKRKVFEIVTEPEGMKARMIAALRINQSCVGCHDEFSGRAGELAGGASIQFPMTQYTAYLATDYANMAMAHGVVLAISLSGIAIAGRRLRRRVLAEWQAEAELRHNEQFLQAVVTSIGDEVRVIDRDYKVRFCNRPLSTENAADAPDGACYCYREWHSLDEPCWSKGAPCPLNDSIASKGHVRREITELHNGARRHVEISASPILDINNEVTAVVEIIRDTTDRKQSMEALRLSEERLDLAVNGAQLATWDSDLVSNSVFVSDRGAAMLGCIPEELPNVIADFSQLLHPDDLQQAFDEFARHASGEKPIFEIEARIRHKAGHWVWTLNRGRIVKEADQAESHRFCGTSLDISDRKRAEQLLLARLRISEYSRLHTHDELLRYILDEAEELTQSCIGFLHWIDEETGTVRLQTWSSNTVATMCTAEGTGLHYPIQEAGVWADAVRTRTPVLHNDYSTLPNRRGLPPCHAPVTREIVVPVIRLGKVVALLGVGNKVADYVPSDLELTSELANMAWDIVGAKQAEDAQRLTETRYRLLMEIAGESIYILDSAGALVECNDAFLRELGYTREEAAGLNVSQWDSQWPLPAISESNEIYETAHRHRDGSSILAEVSLTRFLEGSQTLHCCTARNISQRKRSEITKSAVNRILTILQMADGTQMYDGVLDVLREITQSPFGMFGYIDESGDWNCPSVTREILPGSSQETGAIVFSRASWTGVWGKALVEKTTQVSRGDHTVPSGHAAIQSVIAVPLVHDGLLIGQFALANKESGYTPWDKELLETIASRITPVMHARLERDRERERREMALTALTISERRYRNLFDEMMSGFAVHEIILDESGTPVDYRFLEVNTAWEQMTGIRAQDALGRTVREILPDTEPVWIERFGRAALTGEPDQFESFNKGAGKQFEVRAYSPAANQFAVIIHDVSERARAEEEIKQSNERLGRITQNMPVMMSAFDKHGLIVAWNAECERVTGYSAEEMIGNPRALELLYPDPAYRANLIARWNDNSPSSIGGEATLRCNDGRDRVVNWSNVSKRVPIPGWNTWAVGIDVTDRIEAQKELIQLAAAIEQADESFVVLAIDGSVRYANPAFVRTSGYEHNEIIGAEFHALTLGSNRSSAYRELIGRVLAGQSWRGKVSNTRKDGSTYTAEAVLSPVWDEAGKIVSFVGVGRDITRELELEAQLLQSQKMESVGQLAGGIAHDFNNLLQIINGYAEFARDSIASTEPAYEMVLEIGKAGARAASLVKQLLAFSRRQVMVPEAIDLNDVIAGWLKSLGRVIGEHIRLNFSPGSDLASILADKGMMDQVLMNLCVNARDAMPQGGTLSITTENVVIDELFRERHPYSALGLYVLVKVADTGCGIDAESMEHVFEPFFTTKGPGQGTGLGLATVYGIVKQHGGILNVSSEVGVGTEFRIYFPTSPVPPEPANGTTRQESTPLHGSILLAEDDEQVRRLASRILRHAGLTVLEAADGEEAIALFKEHAAQIDVLLFDVVMPHVGGRQAYDSIRNLGYDPPTIFASGYNEDAIHTGFVLEHGYHLVQKPFEINTLIATLRAALSGELGGKQRQDGN